MSHEVIIGNYQDVISIPESWLTAWEKISPQAAALALEHAALPDSSLSQLTTVEIALVDSNTSARVHLDFMNIDDPTDVITFPHGEIVICPEVARSQAAEYQEPLDREIFRYLVHGLLHLAGHEDESVQDRRTMETAQEEIIQRLWIALGDTPPRLLPRVRTK